MLTRNSNSSFNLAPQVHIPRSVIPQPQDIKTTGNVGSCIPFFVQDVLPGDSHKVSTSKLVRLQTPITPFMDQLYLDTYYFFVPSRLVWTHFKELMGENNDSAWISSIEYEAPQTEAPSGGWTKGTIADYMGVPTNVDNFSISSLYFRSYAKVIEDWFRSEAVDTPVGITLGDSTTTGSNGSNYVTDLELGGKPFVANKLFDYFTGGLPSPQKGQSVYISAVGGQIPVTTGDIISRDVLHKTGMSYDYFAKDGKTTITGGAYFPTSANSSDATVDSDGWVHDGAIDRNGAYRFNTSIDANVGGVVPNNLWADISNGSFNVASVSQLRTAFQLQRMLEKDARGGTRYISLLKSHFGVTSPDARLQRSEFLGGNRVPLNVTQITQNSESGTTPLGTTGAMSITTDHSFDFNKSFTEHGIILGIAVVRYKHSYQQGLHKRFSKKKRYDFYWPALANISELPIYNRELYLQGDNVKDSDGNIIDDQVFAYQEPWAEYRYLPSIATGEFRSNYSQSLDCWHLADDYSSLPTLTSTWLKEDCTNVDRVLQVASTNADQLLFNIYVNDITTRCMPVFSIPGLIDHN